MVLPLSRELALPVVLLALQLLWSQVFPLLPSWYALHQTPAAASPVVTAEVLPADLLAEPLPDVSWLPDLVDADASPSEEGLTVLPVFPVDSSRLFAPGTSGHMLQVFEARYRLLYRDIMSTGLKRLVAVAMDSATGRLAEVGVVFRVEKINKMRGEKFNYVCEHTAIERVRIKQVFKASGWLAGSSYLQAEIELFHDDKQSHTILEEQESALLATFLQLANQMPDNVPVVQVGGTLSTDPDGLWNLAGNWINHYFPTYVRGYLAEKRLRLKNSLDDYLAEIVPNHDGVPAIPEEVLAKVRRLHAQIFMEEQKVAQQQAMLAQKLLQSPSHAERLALLQASMHSVLGLAETSVDVS
eukprot:TRINITY_DN108008_c0_g1_i1.p1 TRINITY_DN108008_c0_g1~~TRINITY_DN108008_c0_g1_i1.p1  ORF type:complete len:356 (-),score=73.04 TRINITY_DN108008_c0_g1_i1:159-1226(-)